MEWIIPEFPNYKINEEGTVFSKRKGYREYKNGPWITKENWKPIKPVLDKGIGYYVVTLINYDDEGNRIKKNQFIHRLLGRAFLPNPENKAHINHIDGNKTNNHLSNLEWATEQENTQHAVATGLMTFEHSEKPVLQMTENYEVLAEFRSAREATDVTGIAFQNISKVVRGIRPRAGGFRWKYK